MSTPVAQFIWTKLRAEMSCPLVRSMHVEEAVLRRLHQHLAHLAVDVEVGEDDVLGGGEVPGLAGRRLIVPDIFAGVGPDRDDRAQVEIVAPPFRAIELVPGRAVADADIEQVELRIVGHRIPDRAAAAEPPPLAVPGLGRAAQMLALEAVRRVAGDGVEAPELVAVGRVIGGDVAAHADIRRRHCR